MCSPLWFVVCILMVSTCSGRNTEDRMTRSLASIGAKTLKRLLSNAIKVLYDPPRKVEYIKLGGYTAALRDYRSIKPSHYRTLVTNEGQLYGKINGNQFFELVAGTAVHPPMLKVSQLAYPVGNKVNALRKPVEIKYLDGRGKSLY